MIPADPVHATAGDALASSVAGSGLVSLVLLGVALYGLVLLIRWIMELLPISRERREMVARLRPMLVAFLAFSYCVFAARTLFRGDPTYMSIAVGALGIAAVSASWFAIRDVVAGVILRTGRACTEGDHVRINGIQGRISAMGLRVMSIETSLGEQAIVPYSAVVQSSLLRTPVFDNVAIRVFRLKAPEIISISAVKSRIRQAAMRCHWASAVREPGIVITEGGELEVTVFSVAADRGPEIEAAVRAAFLDATRH
ncbi:MAG: mechanosensitive ion channel domain-containing protein [Nannocystaceae bacterium]